MQYTDEQLNMIEQFASIYLTITDIAIILEVAPEELREDVNNSGNQAYYRYRKGKAMSKVQLHQQEMTLAKVGSPLALQNARDNLLAMEDDE